MNTNTVSLLERADVAPSNDEHLLTDAQIDEIANSGEDLIVSQVEALGYVPPTVKAKRNEKRAEAERHRQLKEAAKLPLAKILRTAGIKPFTPESVEKYKNAKLKMRFHLTEKDPPAGLIVMIGFVLNMLLVFGACAAILKSLGVGMDSEMFSWSLLISFSIPGVATLGMAALQYLQPIDASKPTSILSWTILIMVCGSGLWIPAICGPNPYEWRLIPLQGYSKDIPRPVLESIAEIHARCPGATFQVDELLREMDPFLVVSFGTEHYHIEVWNEPRFDGKKMA